MSTAVKFPQRGKIRSARLTEEVIVHGVVRDTGIRLYEVEFEDGQRAMWIPDRVELLGPVDES
jgi:hypothetical protein